MAFDPDKYLAKKQAEGAFDPDKYLAAKGVSAPAPEEHSTLGDLATGLHSGSMLGGADELAGIGNALGEKAGNSPEFQKLADWYYAQKMGTSPEALKVADEGQNAPEKSSYDAYRQGQQSAQADQDAARKASPWAYGAGQLLGGLTTGIATAPLAAAAPTATAVGSGALAGFLGSNATIEQPVDLAKDTGIGAATGYALNEILPGGAQSEKDILQRGEFVPQMETAAKMGEEGISLSSKPEARAALTQRLQENERGLADKFISPRETLGKKVGASLSNEGGLTPTSNSVDAAQNLQDLLTGNAKSIGKGHSAYLADKAQKLQQGLLSPQEAYAFRKELSDVSSKIADPEDQQILKTGMDAIKDSLDASSPGFQKATKNFAQFAEKGPEALLSKGHDPDIANVFLGDLNKGDLKISEKVRDLLGSIRSGGEQELKKQGELFNTIQQLEVLAKKNPELVQSLGIDPKNLSREFIQKADEQAVAQKVIGGPGLAQAGYERGIFGLRKATETGALKAANLYGQAKRTVRDFANSSKEQLQSASQVLKQHGGPDIQAIAESLASDVPQKRNAAMFSILQLPKAKQILGIDQEE